MSIAWRRWYSRILPAYWIFLFCTTHFPRLQIPKAPEDSDKALHFGAFGILAFLFWRFLESNGAKQACLAPAALAVLIVYAGLDEYLQQFVGRSSDWSDFLADAIGIVVVVGVFEILRRGSDQRKSV